MATRKIENKAQESTRMTVKSALCDHCRKGDGACATCTFARFRDADYELLMHLMYGTDPLDTGKVPCESDLTEDERHGFRKASYEEKNF